MGTRIVKSINQNVKHAKRTPKPSGPRPIGIAVAKFQADKTVRDDASHSAQPSRQTIFFARPNRPVRERNGRHGKKKKTKKNGAKKSGKQNETETTKKRKKKKKRKSKNQSGAHTPSNRARQVSPVLPLIALEGKAAIASRSHTPGSAQRGTTFFPLRKTKDAAVEWRDWSRCARPGHHGRHAADEFRPSRSSFRCRPRLRRSSFAGTAGVVLLRGTPEIFVFFSFSRRFFFAAVMVPGGFWMGWVFVFWRWGLEKWRHLVGGWYWIGPHIHCNKLSNLFITFLN